MNHIFFRKKSITLCGILLLLFCSLRTFAQNQTIDDESIERKFSCKPCKPFCKPDCCKPCCKPFCKPDCGKPCCKPFCKPICKPDCKIDCKPICKPDCKPCKETVCISCLPFIIKESGHYCLNNSITLAPTPDNPCPTGILIQADNVVLSLGGFGISGAFRGIDIQECSINVIVKCGAIQNTSAEAIRVGKDSKNIQLLDLKVINANMGGVCEGIAGILFDGTFTDNIKDSIVRNVLVADSFGTGFNLSFCQDCKVIDSCALTITSTLASDANGFYVSGNGNIFENCTTTSVLATLSTQSAHGFFAQGASDTLFHGCQASEIIQLNGVGTSEATGFTIANSQCVTCDSCITTSIAGINGFGFESRNSIASSFIECAECLSSAIGFLLSSDIDSFILKCSALNNVIAGFELLNCTSCTVGKSKAVDNGTGFILSGGTNNRFYLNYASGNGTNYTGITPIVVLGAAPVLGGNISA